MKNCCPLLPFVSILAIGAIIAGTLASCGDQKNKTPGATRYQAPPAADDGTPRVLVAYYSLTGRTERMAGGVVEGIRRVAGVNVQAKQVGDITKDDLARADGIVLGAPTFYANIPGAMKAVIDDWSWKWKIDFTDKVGGAFATGGEPSGGQQHVVTSLFLHMLNNRMVIVGPLHETRTTQYGSMGATAVTGRTSPEVDEVELEYARKLGERVASMTKRLFHAPADAERKNDK